MVCHNGNAHWVRCTSEIYIVVDLFLRSTNKLIFKMSLELLDTKTALKSGSRDSSAGKCWGKVNKGMLRLFQHVELIGHFCLGNYMKKFCT